jgi:hypothetical protein
MWMSWRVVTVWWWCFKCRYLLDVLHEQEKLVTTMSEAAVIGGRQHEGAEGGAMTRWTTEEDLSTQNILQCKACSLADFTQGTY